MSGLREEVNHWINVVGCLDDLSEEERNDIQAVADHVAAKISDSGYASEHGYNDSPEDSQKLVDDVADIIQKGTLVSITFDFEGVV